MINPFEYHKPNEEEIARIERVREAYLALLEAMTQNTRAGNISGRYQALAKTALEESCMWATKSIVFERDNAPQPEPARTP